MLIRKKLRKFQSGGSLNQAKNAGIALDTKWAKFDLSGFKPDKLDLPSGSARGLGSSGSASEDGLPSDVAYVDGEIAKLQGKIKEGLTGANSAEYKDSAFFKQDQDELTRWSQIRGSMLKPRMDDYKSSATRLAKAKDDLAITGNTVLAKDNQNGGALSIVSVDDILTGRTTVGKITSPRYQAVTVGEALALRFEDKNFSGFTEKGAQIDKILKTVIDSSEVDTQMDTLFKKAGSIKKESNQFTVGGVTKDLDGLLKDLSEASAVYGKSTIKSATNRANLEAAVSIFKQNLSPGHLESLRNKAIGKFNTMFGNRGNINPAEAEEYVNNLVNSYIADRASIFLNEATGKTGAPGSSSGSGSKQKRELYMNAVEVARTAPTGTMVMEQKYEDAGELKSNLGTFKSSTLNVDGVFNKEIAGSKSKLIKPSESEFIKKIAGNLENNFFLPDADSTPIASLNGGTGLENVVINNTAGTQMKIMQGVPYFTEKDGTKRIAWNEIKDMVKWGETYKSKYNEKRNALGKAWLSDQEKWDVIKETIKATGSNISDEQIPNLRMGDVAVLPIVFRDRTKFDEKLADVFSGNVSSAETELGKNLTGFWVSDEVKVGFAMSIMPDDDFNALDINYYGPEMKKEKPVDLDLLEAYFNSSQNNNFERARFLQEHATVIPTTPSQQ